ncbi:MAG: hypothetical protein KDI36_00575 [Pseudomonadales bacterium]|nr:hypothetical protein [Pseudomonadales bacterium]
MPDTYLRPSPAPRPSLLMALMLAAGGHLPVLFWLNLPQTEPTISVSTLRVDLQPWHQQPEPEKQPEQTKQPEKQPEPVKDQQPQQSLPVPRPIPAPNPLPTESPPPESQTDRSASVNQPPLRIIEALTDLRKSGIPQPKPFRSFSTADFPGQESEPAFIRASIVPTLLHSPGTRTKTQSDGTTWMKSTDSNGNVVCAYQRVVPGDGNGAMWFRVPADRCGHL